jgi:hypothetical protein
MNLMLHILNFFALNCLNVVARGPFVQLVLCYFHGQKAAQYSQNLLLYASLFGFTT